MQYSNWYRDYEKALKKLTSHCSYDLGPAISFHLSHTFAIPLGGVSCACDLCDSFYLIKGKA